MKIIYLKIILFIFPSIILSQENKTVQGLINKYKTIEDYEVSVKIVANIPMLKMKETRAVMYFMQKDKFKIQTSGIAVLPKQGVNDLMTFINSEDKYVVMESDGKKINGEMTSQLTLIPNNEDEDIVLCKLWIEPKNFLIYQSQVTTKSSGTVKTNYTYDKQIDYGLPSTMIFELEVKKFKMPKSVAANIHSSKKSDSNKENEKGFISVFFSDYIINQGAGKKVFD